MESGEADGKKDQDDYQAKENFDGGFRFFGGSGHLRSLGKVSHRLRLAGSRNHGFASKEKTSPQRAQSTQRKLRSGGAEDEPEEFAVEEEDGDGDTPGEDGSGARVDEVAHFGALAGELNEWNHGERQLKTENDLTEDQERSELPFPGNADDEDCGNDGDSAGDEAAQPGLQANIEKTFHDDLAGERAGERGVLPGSEQSAREKSARKAGAEDGTEEFVGLGDIGDFVEAAGVERGGAEDKDGGVDEQREKQGDSGIEDGVTQGFALFGFLMAEGAGLHDAGVQIEIVGHHRGAEDTDGDIEHFLVAQNFGAGDESAGGFAPDRVSEKDLVGEADPDAGDESDNEGFDQAEAAALESKNDEDIERGEQNAEKERNVEKEIERYGGAEDFGEVAGGDGKFAGDPQENGHAAGIVVAAGLSEVASGDDAELRGKRLKKHGEDVADEHDAEERVAEFGAAAEVGGPIAGVHISDGDKIAGTGEGQDFAKPVGVVGDGDAAVGFGEGGESESATPCGGLRFIGGEGRGCGETLGEDVRHQLY
jgi:hypothetical protein